MPAVQTYKTHVRFDPIWHFFIAPVMLLNVIFSIVVLVRHWPNHGHFLIWWIVLSVALLLAVGRARQHSLKVQDRIIRLEERLRMAALLSADDFARSRSLTEAQFVALRFASDSELPALVNRTLNENLSQKQIKKAITNWRPDTFRV